MDIYQAAHLYNDRFAGVNAKSLPSQQAQAELMQSAVVMAEESSMPADGRFRYLEQLVAHVSKVAPESAAKFDQWIVNNPGQQEFAKSLEMGLAVMAKRSPETWQHIKNHTALTMQFYERQMQQHGGTPNDAEMLTLFTGALGHDMGKIGLDPALLHKSTRVDPQRFSQAFEAYGNSVPDYQEKLHDMLFLDEANKGRVLFAGPGQSSGAQGNVIVDLGKNMRRSEEYWVGDAERQRHNAIFERINALAEMYVVPKEPGAWLGEREKQALTMAQRGTVTPEEMRAIETHDNMSEAFFKAAPVPPELSGVTGIVSMDRFRPGRAPVKDDSVLADVIHTTDVFEAITGNRSYRKPYTVEEAVKVMDGMAQQGKVNADVLNSLKASGTIEAYAEAAGLQHSPDMMAAAPQPAKATWVQKIGGNSASTSSWTTTVSANGQRVEISGAGAQRA